MKINRISFVPGPEIENLTVPAFPGAATPEDFTAFKPGKKNDLVWRWDRERLAVHFRVLNFKTAINPRRDGMAGVAYPKSFPLARLPPSERASCSHQAFENLGIMGGMKGDKPHALPNAAKNAIDDGILDLSVSSVSPPNEHIGLCEPAFR